MQNFYSEDIYTVKNEVIAVMGTKEGLLLCSEGISTDQDKGSNRRTEQGDWREDGIALVLSCSERQAGKRAMQKSNEADCEHKFDKHRCYYLYAFPS